MRPVIVDIGEFYNLPLRTGIQRTVWELISHWPKEIPVQFVRYDPLTDGFISISNKAIQFLMTMFGSNIFSAEQIGAEVRILDAGEHSHPIYLQTNDRVLIPELFYSRDRVEFYRRAIAEDRFKSFFLIYDFVPWLKPDLYKIGPNMNVFMPYLHLTLEMQNRAYISAAVRDDFIKRISRQQQSGGPVLILGANGIGLEPQVFRKERRNFVCLGTFEAKKRQDIVFEAFRSLPNDGHGGKLQFLGKVPTNFADRLKPILEYKGTDIEVIDGPSDEEIRVHLRSARASIFISPNEGFGLPALETLYSCIPTVVCADLPSVVGLPAHGQIRLSSVDVQTLASTILRLRDDDEAEALWTSAAKLELPTWEDFAMNLVSWVIKE